MEEQAFHTLQAKLDAFYTWPSVYTFKFIVPAPTINELEEIFAGKPIRRRFSKNARYVSVTAEMEMSSSGEVISYYRRAAEIKGVIAL